MRRFLNRPSTGSGVNGSPLIECVMKNVPDDRRSKTFKQVLKSTHVIHLNQLRTLC